MGFFERWLTDIYNWNDNIHFYKELDYRFNQRRAWHLHNRIDRLSFDPTRFKV